MSLIKNILCSSLLTVSLTTTAFATDSSSQTDQIKVLKAQIAQLEREKEKNSVIFTFIADSVSGFDGQPNEMAINVGKRAANIAMAIEEPESDFLQCWTEEVNSRDYFRERTYGVLEQCIDKVKNETISFDTLDILENSFRPN